MVMGKALKHIALALSVIFVLSATFAHTNAAQAVAGIHGLVKKG
jgi:hypothetical protein